MHWCAICRIASRRRQLVGGDAAFEQLVAKVVGFVEAPQLGLDLPLDVRGTAFQQRVWQALREIPAGYDRELRRDRRADRRAEGGARGGASLRRQSVAVAIPCHRVVRPDGALSGYRWGVERKRALLERGGRGMSTMTRTRTRTHQAPTETSASGIKTLDWARIGDDLDAHGCAVDRAVAVANSNARRSPPSMRRRSRSAAASSWRGTASAAANTSISPIRCRSWSRACARRSIRRSPRSPTAGTRRMGVDLRYPPEHAAFLARCQQAGQGKPTPLLLQYGEGDYNCLHQDIYGEHVFPLQVAVLLSQPGSDFTGGEFVLTEQRPRMQSRAEVVPLRQGEGVIFPVHHRPVQGTRGIYRVNMRHGVSRSAQRPPPHARHHLPRRQIAERSAPEPFDRTRCVRQSRGPHGL